MAAPMTPETYHLVDDNMLMSEGRSVLLHEAAAVEGNNADCTAAARRRDVLPV